VRVRALALVLLLGSPAHAAAEWQFKPFIAVTLGGSTTFFDLEQAAGKRHLVLGGSTALIGEIVGIEGEFAWAPGFFDVFESGDRNLVLQSSVRTLTGNVIIAAPRRFTEYTLRPYFVGGLGAMQVRRTDRGPGGGPIFPVRRTLPVLNVGGGATGFLSDRIGLGWDVRLFHSLGGKDELISDEFGKLSFWRANMSLVIRY
jgi:hypothetical protein